MPDDPNSTNPVKLKKPFRLNDECLWYVREQLFRAIEMFMDHLDFEIKPWDTEDPITGKTGVVYVEDKNILRKMYKLKNIYENQQRAAQSPQQILRPNPNNWNFGSVPPELLGKTKKKT